MKRAMGVLTGMDPGQMPMYHGMQLNGPDPYEHMRDGGCEDIQHQLGLIGDYRSRHPETIHPIEPMGYPNAGYGAPAGYGGYHDGPSVVSHTGGQFYGPLAGAYYNTYFRR